MIIAYSVLLTGPIPNESAIFCAKGDNLAWLGPSDYVSMLARAFDYSVEAFL